MPERLLIVGGTGFIGSHLAARAVKSGFDTLVLSLNPPAKERKVDGVSYISADVSNYIELKNKLPKKSFDYVVNLSGYIDHSSFLDGGSQTIDTHFGGVKNLVNLIDWENLKRFVEIGSSDEYGNHPAPQNEEMPSYPISPYSFSKSASIQLLKMLHRTESFPATMLRLFLVYGPGQDNHRFLPQVIQGCLTNSTFPVSLGDQLRDFCYVENIIDGIFLSLDNNIVNGEIINLGSGDPISIRHVIDYVKTNIGSGKPEYGKIPYRLDENMELYADISKATNLLGWKEKLSFKVGMEETIKYYLEIYK